MAYIRRNGEVLCAMAWEGYERLGRGAVFANYDADAQSVAVVGKGAKAVRSGIPSFYVDRARLVTENEKSLDKMKPILDRIDEYDPDKQFVVVFEAFGTQGADIVTPNQLPSEVWARTQQQREKNRS